MSRVAALPCTRFTAIEISDCGRQDPQPHGATLEQSKLPSPRDSELHHVAAPTEPAEIVRPRLHHLAPFIETLCAIVGGSHFIAFLVRERQLDDVGRVSL